MSDAASDSSAPSEPASSRTACSPNPVTERTTPSAVTTKASPPTPTATRGASRSSAAGSAWGLNPPTPSRLVAQTLPSSSSANRTVSSPWAYVTPVTEVSFASATDAVSSCWTRSALVTITLLPYCERSKPGEGTLSPPSSVRDW